VDKFDLGIALDGDADRVAAVAPEGCISIRRRSSGCWPCICTRTAAGPAGSSRQSPDGDDGAHRARPGVKLYETPVGFKYIPI